MLTSTDTPIRRGQRTVWHPLLASLALALTCSGTHAQTDGVNDLVPYGAAFSAIERAPKTQTRVYAFRTGDAVSPWPVNLYLNGRYHASLLRGGYTEFCTSENSWNLQSTLNDAERLYAGKQQTGLALSTRPGQVLFLQVLDNAGRIASVQSLSEAQAAGLLRQTRLQQHTVSRAPLAQECSTDLVEPAPAVPAAVVPPPQPAPVAKAAPPTREYALETDAVFEFGKAELRPAGFNAIENLIQQVHKDYSAIDRIRVLGYSDAIGPAKLNRKLSLERAKAVAERLSDRGLKAKRPIQTEGRGDEELVKTHCHNSPTPANKACHAPNRRVVIVVYGVRR